VEPIVLPSHTDAEFIATPAAPDAAWTVWDVVIVAGIFLLAVMVTSALAFKLAGAYLLDLAKAGDLAANPLVSVPIQCVAYLVTFVFVRIYISGKARTPFWAAVKWNAPTVALLAQLLALGVLLALVVQFASALLPVPKNLPVEQYFRSRDSIWLVAAFGTIAAPLAEEIFFRGLLFPALRRMFHEPESIAGLGILLWFLSAIPFVWVFYRYQRISLFGIAILVAGALIIVAARLVRNRNLQNVNTAAAIVVTGLLFALLHQGQLARAWAPLLLLFVVGVVLTTVRARLDSLAASWIVHAGYNATLFALLYAGTSGFKNLERISQ